MNIFDLKMIALFAMLADHIALFFPELPFSLLLHWAGRISAPIFIFGIVNGVMHTYSPKKYLFRLYLSSIFMAAIQAVTQIGLNFLRTLFITASVIFILELRKTQKLLYRKVFLLYIAYQACSSILCIYFITASSSNLENICFYFLPAIFGNILMLEGGLLWVLLGILMYAFYEHKKMFCFGYATFIILYTVCYATALIPEALWKMKQVVPFLGNEAAHVTEFILLPAIIGIDPAAIGGSLFTQQYQWMMIFALPFILSYHHQQGRKWKYFFYFFYPLHIILLWFCSNL